MKTRIACVLAAVVMVMGLADGASAQGPADAAESRAGAEAPAPRISPAARQPGRARSFELTASVFFLAPSSLGTRNANLTSNDLPGTAYRWFSANGKFRSAPGIDVRGSYNVTGAIAVEGGLTYSRPAIAFTVANDTEGASDFTAPGETVSQFFVDASLVAYLSRYRFAGGRARPFVEVGAGYLRELHGQASAASGYLALESGQVYHAGAGVKYFFRPRPTGFVKAYGLRFDARFYVRNGGFSFDGSHSKTFAVGGGLVVAF